MSKLIVTQSNRGAPDPIGLHDASGDLINPATVEKLEELKTVLSSIQTAVENISIDADSVNLNTDELEAKIQSVRDQLDVLLSTRASESTLQLILSSIGSESGTNLLIELQYILSNISSLATENTLIQIKDYLDTVETKLQSLIDKNVAQETGGNLSLIKTNLDDVKTKLDTLNSKDFATQTTLALIKTDLDNIYSQLDIALSTRASESTLSSIYNRLNITLSDLRDSVVGISPNNKTLKDINDTLLLIKAKTDNLDVALSTIATETTLSSAKINLDNILSKLDVNLSTRLADSTFTGRVGEVQISPTSYTILARLKDIWDKLHDLFINGLAKIQLWDGTDYLDINSDGSINTVESIFPKEANKKQIIDVRNYTIVSHKGNLFQEYIHIPSENMEYREDVVQALTSSGINRIVQVFRASADNVHDISIILKGELLSESAIVDNFNSYNNSTELTAVWLSSDSTNTTITLDNAIYYEGGKAMKVALKQTLSINDTITKTYGVAQNWSLYDSIKFYFRANRNDGVYKLRIGDGTNTASASIGVVSSNTWEEKNISFSNFIADGITFPNLSVINTIQIEIISLPAATNINIDNITVNNIGSLGYVSVRLYDFGSNSNPSTLPSAITLDEGITSITQIIDDTETLYSLHVHKNSHILSGALTIGNYYGIEIEYLGSHMVQVFGSISNNRYVSGEVYSISGTTMTSLGTNKDIFFVVFCRKDFILTEIKFRTIGSGDSSKLNFWITNYNSSNIKHYLLRNYIVLEADICQINLKYPITLLSEDSFEINWNDSSISSATELIFEIHGIYDEFIIYG